MNNSRLWSNQLKTYFISQSNFLIQDVAFSSLKYTLPLEGNKVSLTKDSDSKVGKHKLYRNTIDKLFLGFTPITWGKRRQ